MNGDKVARTVNSEEAALGERNHRLRLDRIPMR
jgi:hypothetical protein